MQSFLKSLALASAGAPHRVRIPHIISCTTTRHPESAGTTARLTASAALRSSSSARRAQILLTSRVCACPTVSLTAAQTCSGLTGAADETQCCADLAAYTLLAMTNTANAAVGYILFTLESLTSRMAAGL